MLKVSAICILAGMGWIQNVWCEQPQIVPEEPEQKELVKLIEKQPTEYGIEVGGTLDSFNTMEYVGGRSIMVSRFQPNVELVIENVGNRDVVNPRIVINDRHDWFSLDTLVAELVTP